MKLLLALAGLSAMIIPGATTHADPGSDDAPATDTAGFLLSLRNAGISYDDPEQATSAAKAVCDLASSGKSGLEVLRGLMTANPGFSTDGAAQFAAIAANSYCPHQLVSDSGGER